MILSICPNPSVDCYAWLERITPGEVNRIGKLEEFPGGKGVHIAFAINELGGTSKVMGNWAGASGEWLKNTARSKGIGLSGIQLEGNNRKCYTLRSSDTSYNNTEILEPGPQISKKNWLEFKTLFEAEISKAEIICLSGSWPVNSPTNAYLQLINIANKQDKKVILDCSGPQLREALQSTFFALHINENEALELCGSTDFDVLLQQLDGRVELVAMTRGKDGLTIAYQGKILSCNVEIDQVISTVGSGDCLTAGLAIALERGGTLEEVAAYGVACGAANCINEDLGMLRKKDVENLLSNVNCKNLKNEF